MLNNYLQQHSIASPSSHFEKSMSLKLNKTMKTKILSVFIFLPLIIFGQSSARDSFELNFQFNRSIENFKNIQLFYIAGTGITSCHFQIDSLENNSNYCKVKLYGEYRYFGGGNFIFPTFILSETKNQSIQNYLIHVDFSAQRKTSNKDNEQKSVIIPIELTSSLPFIELAKNQDESIVTRNFQFLAELQSMKQNEYFFKDLFTWTKIFPN